jgi:hypothetical protein
MYYAFHDIKNILQPYIDNLPTHSMCRQDHLTHLRAIFLHCCYYRMCLNPHKCVFCVESRHLLGFILSMHGIRVDPLKVEAILNLPPPSTLRKLQSLQGKENFLRRFIRNYTELMKGFTWLLKKGYDYVWDDTANKTFESLKLALTRTPLLFPPNYSRDYFLYLAASDSTISMVLVQEEDSHDEHVIYYLSRSITTTETKYLHVEKLDLESIQDVQRFRHYILLHRTIVIFDCNPMQHILTRQLLGGDYYKWIVILQEFDLKFEHANSMKSFVFAELICDLPSTGAETLAEDSLPDESLFLISSDNIWYGDIIIYLQTQKFWHDLSSPDHHHIWYQSCQYIILVIPFTSMVLIPYFDDVSPTMKLRKLLMIVTMEHVVVMCLCMPLPKISYDLVIYGLHCLRITLLSSRNATLVKPTTIRSDLTLILFTLYFSSAHSLNGVLTS